MGTVTQDIRSALRAAFWSGDLSEKKWRRAIRDPAMGHQAILKTSFEHMPSPLLIREMGEKEFIKRWPSIRKLFDANNPGEYKRLLLFDAIWGILTTGDSRYPVSEQTASLSKGRLQILREVVRHPGVSIYTLSRKLGRDYSRIFKEVKMLASQKLLEIKKDRIRGRNVSRLFARHSINTELFNIHSRRGQIQAP